MYILETLSLIFGKCSLVTCHKLTNIARQALYCILCSFWWNDELYAWSWRMSPQSRWGLTKVFYMVINAGVSEMFWSLQRVFIVLFNLESYLNGRPRLSENKNNSKLLLKYSLNYSTIVENKRGMLYFFVFLLKITSVCLLGSVCVHPSTNRPLINGEKKPILNWIFKLNLKKRFQTQKQRIYGLINLKKGAVNGFLSIFRFQNSENIQEDHH